MEIDTTRMGPAQPPRQLFPTFSGLHAIHPSATSKRTGAQGHNRGPKEGIDKIVNNLRKMNLSLPGEVSFENQGLDDDKLEEITNMSIILPCPISRKRGLSMSKDSLKQETHAAPRRWTSSARHFLQSMLVLASTPTPQETQKSGDPMAWLRSFSNPTPDQ